MKGQPGQDNWDRTTGTGQPGHDRRDTVAGQGSMGTAVGQDAGNYYMTARPGQPGELN
jgi:hypothetical protein